MGVTYFKLTKGIYPGDTTKGCSLTGGEIDGNFHFLRGNDIDGLLFDDVAHELVVKRVNGKEICVPINVDLDGYKFDFDDDGVLIITYPSGVVKRLGGFAPSYTYTDDSLNGDGTSKQPLGISSGYRTGTYAPVKSVEDTLPLDVEKGYRVITHEKYNTFGRLYNYDDLMKIAHELSENSKKKWRIPTKKDWDDMLNAVEVCDDYRTHDLPDTGVIKGLGHDAGAFLKSNSNMWKEGSTDAKGIDSYGFSVLPVGWAEFREEGYVENSYKTSAYFWTSDKGYEEGSNEIYIKRFDYDLRTVRQDDEPKDKYFSLRLVRDYDNDFSDIEYILGYPVPCVLMPKSRQIWTQVNVPFAQAGDAEIGKILPIWEEDEEFYHDEEAYFINECDGNNEWTRKQMKVGDSVVIEKHYEENEAIMWHEWRIVPDEEGNDILIDTVKPLRDELLALIAEIRAELENEEEERKKEDEEIRNELHEEASIREDADRQLQANLDTEATSRIEADNALRDLINTEATSRIAADDALRDLINTEAESRIEADKALQANLDTEATSRIEADNALRDLINTEAETRLTDDNILRENINTEAENRLAGDNALTELINTEATSRLEADDALRGLINTEAETRLTDDNTLRELINTEATNRIAADDALRELINTEATSRLAGDDALRDLINTEAISRLEADRALQDNIDAEATSRLEADEILNSEIQTEANTREENDEQIVADYTAQITLEKEQRINADILLTNDLAAETSARTDADIILEDKIADETNARETEDTAINGRIDTEIEDRKNADNEIKDEFGAWHIVEVTAQSEEYISSYELQDGEGNVKGARINIAKDRFIEEVKFGKFTWTDEDGNVHTSEYALRFRFVMKDGSTKDVYVTVDDFLHNEFGDGLEIVDGIIQVRLAVACEPFLTVSKDGLSLNGVQNAIDEGDEALGDRIDGVIGGELVEGYRSLHEIGHTVTAATQALSTSIETEKNRAIAKEEELQNNLDTEIASRIETDENLEALINTEITDRTTADTELTERIIALEEENAELKRRLDELETDFENKVKSLIASTLLGVEKQISIQPEYSASDPTKLEKLKIGFDDDAEFIADNV